MAKRGRKKVEGVVREPNGRASRSEPVRNIQRMLDAVRVLGHSTRFGTNLGRLVITERITPAQYDIGTWFSDIRSAADAALGLPPRNPTAQDMNAVHGAPNGFDTPEEERAKKRAIETYDRAVSFLGHGSKRLAAMELVCIYDRRPDTHEQFLALVEGLDMLIKYRSQRRAA